jgi:hypothetical protein
MDDLTAVLFYLAGVAFVGMLIEVARAGLWIGLLYIAARCLSFQIQRNHSEMKSKSKLIPFSLSQ